MYTTGGLLPADELPPGTTLLCVGPPMAGKRELVLRLLGTGTESVDATVLVSTDSSSRGIRADYAAHVDGEQPRVGVVDCTGETYGAELEGRDSRTVSSGPELGQVGATVDDVVSNLDGDGGRVRVGILSLTSLALHAGEDATATFVRGLTGITDECGGLTVVTVHTDSFRRTAIDRFEGIADGVVEVRDDGDGVSVGLRGLGVDETRTVPLTGRVRSDVADAEPTATGTARPPPPAAAEFDSLADLIARFDERRPTLTVCNRERPDRAFDRVSAYFERLGIAVRETTLGTETPTDSALLHRGDQLVAASSLPAIEAGIASETAELDPFASDRGPDVLAAIDGDVYGAVDMDKQSLIDASTAIEMTAWRVGGGEFHAGFQKLSRCFASPRSRRVMRRLADAGVDVHVYGEPDVVPEPDHRNLTAHPDRSREIARSWFVAYDGDGDPDRQAALVVQEDGEQRYHGFWTYEAGVARAVVAYVADTYLGAAEREAAA